MPGGLDAMFGGSGLKRLRLLLEEDDDDPNLRPGMRNGLCERRGGWGWTPLSKLYREEEGQEARRQEWHKSKLWLLLGDTNTGDPDTIAGAPRFREMLAGSLVSCLMSGKAWRRSAASSATGPPAMAKESKGHQTSP